MVPFVTVMRLNMGVAGVGGPPRSQRQLAASLAASPACTMALVAQVVLTCLFVAMVAVVAVTTLNVEVTGWEARPGVDGNL